MVYLLLQTPYIIYLFISIYGLKIQEILLDKYEPYVP